MIMWKLIAIAVLLPFAMLIFMDYVGSISVNLFTPAGETALSTQVSVSGPDAQQIEVTLDEFSISPSPLRIPTGQPVTLVVKNVGQIPHEFMAGRQVQGNDFEHDLFAGLHVNIWGGTSGEVTPNDHMDAEGGSSHHGGDHEQGTMVEPEPGQIVYMSFTLPESRRGEWSTGCFLPGHYAAGMYGTLIVE